MYCESPDSFPQISATTEESLLLACVLPPVRVPVMPCVQCVYLQLRVSIFPQLPPPFDWVLVITPPPLTTLSPWPSLAWQWPNTKAPPLLGPPSLGNCDVQVGPLRYLPAWRVPP